MSAPAPRPLEILDLGAAALCEGEFCEVPGAARATSPTAEPTPRPRDGAEAPEGA